jgi:HPt (histidine-containing phosphotransfer) domain-containing protein
MKGLPPEVLAELRAEYLNSCPEILSEIKNAAAKSDWPSVEHHFHRFAGSGKTFGLPEVTDVARAIEYYIQKNSTPSPKVMDEAIRLFESIVLGYAAGKAPDAGTLAPILKKIA